MGEEEGDDVVGNDIEGMEINIGDCGGVEGVGVVYWVDCV